MSKINDKIGEIETFLKELESIIPDSLENYEKNLEKKAACERYVEKIMEAATDLAFLIIKIKGFEIPDDDIDAFDILQKKKMIDEGLSKKLKDAKGMRNIIAHQYGKINDRIIFHSITEELKDDVKKFVNSVSKWK